MKLFRGRSGFTLIELLVVILILAILMAIALPLYLRAVADSEKQTCRSNMQTIANAEQAYKVRSPGHVYTTTLSELVTSTVVDNTDPANPVTTTVTGDLQAIPRCPKADPTSAGPDYSVAEVKDANGLVTGFTVSCDVTGSGHGTFTPGVDSQ